MHLLGNSAKLSSPSSAQRQGEVVALTEMRQSFLRIFKKIEIHFLGLYFSPSTTPTSCVPECRVCGPACRQKEVLRRGQWQKRWATYSISSSVDTILLLFWWCSTLRLCAFQCCTLPFLSPLSYQCSSSCMLFTFVAPSPPSISLFLFLCTLSLSLSLSLSFSLSLSLSLSLCTPIHNHRRVDS